VLRRLDRLKMFHPDCFPYFVALCKRTGINIWFEINAFIIYNQPARSEKSVRQCKPTAAWHINIKCARIQPSEARFGPFPWFPAKKSPEKGRQCRQRQFKIAGFLTRIHLQQFRELSRRVPRVMCQVEITSGTWQIAGMLQG